WQVSDSNRLPLSAPPRVFLRIHERELPPAPAEPFLALPTAANLSRQPLHPDPARFAPIPKPAPPPHSLDNSPNSHLPPKAAAPQSSACNDPDDIASARLHRTRPTRPRTTVSDAVAAHYSRRNARCF